MAKRVKYHVVYIKVEKLWRVKRSGRLGWDRDTKAEAVQSAITNAKKDVRDGLLAQVLVHRKDGVIQRETTYPRSSDPSPPKG